MNVIKVRLYSIIKKYIKTIIARELKLIEPKIKAFRKERKFYDIARNHSDPINYGKKSLSCFQNRISLLILQKVIRIFVKKPV